MYNRFAVIKLWENTSSAEDENIARLVNAAREIGVECVPIDRNYRVISDRSKVADEDEFDFVIHLHFDSVKINNLFSFVTLWNPISFYHEWGYRRFSDALLTHDDFLSCSSVGADRHVKRLIYNDPYHLPPQFTLYHSLSSPIYEPSKKKNKKLFYCGINWEKLGKKAGRHTELLKHFDNKHLIDIYGPEELQGVKVWAGYDGYRGEVPFDGTSMIDKIHKSGIALVLSSKAHIESELMSNRLFESLAAGANIICDQNPFARKYFGDLFYYIDTETPILEQCQKIEEYISSINASSNEAYERAKEAQRIFLQDFELKQSLKAIYNNFLKRKTSLNQLYSKESKHLIKICHICNEEIEDIAKNIKNNVDKSIQHIIYGMREDIDRILSIAKDTSIKFEEIKRTDSTATIIEKFLESIKHDEFFGIILPGESVLRDHFKKLAFILESYNYDCVYSQILIATHEQDKVYIPWNITDPYNIRSLANFLFSGAMLGDNIKYTIPDIQTMFPHFLYLAAKSKCSIKSYTCIVNEKYVIDKVNINDINVINDIYKLEIENPNINKNENDLLKFIKRRLRFLKKYPIIWRALRIVQQRLFLR